MVDVSQKPPTYRQAIAQGRVLMSPATRQMIVEGRMPKGDAVAVARVAGIMAAKETPHLIPLCHPLPLSSVEVEITPLEEGMLIEARVATTAPTGVEMEALTAVSVAGLTLYDMIKAVERAAVITGIELVAKSGGKSGDYHRDPA